MTTRFIRIFQRLDIETIKQHCLIYGDISGHCAKCQAVDLKLDAHQCPGCHTTFQYIAFLNIKNHMPKLPKILEQRPEVVFVDHEDLKKNLGVLKAEEFWR